MVDKEIADVLRELNYSDKNGCTLEELIRHCGSDFRSVEEYRGGFIAQGVMLGKNYQAVADTKENAVAKLLIKLNGIEGARLEAVE